MKTEYEYKTEMFEFELAICWEKLEVWKYEALKLFYSAQVLHEFESIKTSHIFDKQPEEFTKLFSADLTQRSYFNYRTQRMLWAYGFENIFKGIVLAGIKQSGNECTKVPLDQIKGHQLVKLAHKAKVKLSEEEGFYLSILEKCSVWAGRYPLPISEDKMYQSRKPMRSSEELCQRALQRYQDYIDGKIPRLSCESDVLHSGVGFDEYRVYMELKEVTIAEFDKRVPSKD